MSFFLGGWCVRLARDILWRDGGRQWFCGAISEFKKVRGKSDPTVHYLAGCQIGCPDLKEK